MHANTGFLINMSIYTVILLKFWIDALVWETENTYTDLVTDSATVSLNFIEMS